jgi:hypothetical protein
MAVLSRTEKKLERFQHSTGVNPTSAARDVSRAAGPATPGDNEVFPSGRSTTRFTPDGSDSLEQRLCRICDQVREGIERIIPPRRLHAVVLGGGYGRGEGGVLRAKNGDEPYNDIEFYVFVRRRRLWSQRKYAGALCALEKELSSACGLHVEFKLDSLQRLRAMPITMFTYDLVSAHRLLAGAENIFRGCEHHLRSEYIPLGEATRLLYNRCSGLLLVRELLGQGSLTDEQCDFIGRNLAKASLALGDAVLVAAGQYHWSARIRAERFAASKATDEVPDLQALQKHHRAGVEFKFHPQRIFKTPEEFRAEHREVSFLAQRVWLWIEGRRLGHSFANINEYAFSGINKCPESAPGRNYLLTLRTFGPAAAIAPLADRYPRERLFNSLPLLLWNGEVSREPEVQRHLQKQLRSTASDWAGLVAAYKEIWPPYG